MIIIDILVTIMFVYLLFFNVYFFVFSLASKIIGYRRKRTKILDQGKFLVLIPSYKEDLVILNTAKKAALHNYPQDKFEVCIIADHLLPKTIEKLKNIPVSVLEVNFEKSTKAKSINKALATIKGDFDYVFVLDADNIMETDCLSVTNEALQSGFLAVQAHRTAKNKNSSFAALDGMSEEINNNIFRKGHRALGLSSALIGSGMGFDYNYYKTRMFGVEEMGGEDREMELRVLLDRNVIEYVEDAIVYDEKVQDVEVFAKQRTRWLAGQFYFLRKHGFEGLRQLFRGNIDYFNKVLQTMIPPRVIMFGAIPLFAILSYFFDLTPRYNYWLLLLLIMVIAMLTAIPLRLYDRKLFMGLLQIPKAVVFMVLGVLNIRTAHDTNFHTPHNTEDKEV